MPQKNVYEMFAECYCLLMTGNCRSKDVIKKYFPNTLQDVKEYVEKVRKLPCYMRLGGSL